MVRQQFDIARQVLASGLVPIIEPEVSIESPERGAAERILLKDILAALDTITEGRRVMLKLTIPAEAGLFKPLVQHPKVLRVLALSGGFSREEALPRAGKESRHDRELQPRLAVRPPLRPERRRVRPQRWGPRSTRFTKRRHKR